MNKIALIGLGSGGSAIINNIKTSNADKVLISTNEIICTYKNISKAIPIGQDIANGTDCENFIQGIACVEESINKITNAIAEYNECILVVYISENLGFSLMSRLLYFLNNNSAVIIISPEYKNKNKDEKERLSVINSEIIRELKRTNISFYQYKYKAHNYLDFHNYGLGNARDVWNEIYSQNIAKDLQILFDIILNGKKLDEYCFNQGKQKFDKKKYKESIYDFESAINLNRKNALAYQYLIKAKCKIKKNGRSI